MAIAEDNDEYGARRVVATVVGGVVEIVHRRYVLNADPADAEAVEATFADLGGDLRLDDVGTPEAAAAAFGVPVGPVVAAEAEAASAWEEIGVVGGPFPWWEALQLPWPVPAQGEPL